MSLCQSLYPHTVIVMQYSMIDDNGRIERASLLNGTAVFDTGQGRYKSAEENVLAAFQLRKQGCTLANSLIPAEMSDWTASRGVPYKPFASMVQSLMAL